MFTEAKQISDTYARRGWVFYDGDCALCRDLADRCERILRRRGFGLAPLQTPWVTARLALPPNEPLEEMKVLTATGEVIGGADAVLYIARAVWWASPLYAIAQLPGMRPVLRSAYRWIAEHRHCIGGACTRPKAAGWRGWLPLALFPPLVIMLRPHLSPWAFMWMLAVAVYAGCKWLTWWQARAQGTRTSAIRSLGYLFAWPGMDARTFCNVSIRPPKPVATEWGMATFKTAFGALLLWGVARTVPPEHVLLTGWIGLLGLIFLLHFGTFHLLALLWQRAGVNARPIMQAPALATSLSDFWGRRWNLGFHQLAHDLVFQPLRKHTGPAGATLIVFLASGLIHELVISFPAGAGYGLPTAYFMLQGLGLIVERSALGKRLNLRHGLSGWVFTLLFTAGPAFWLFHPPFVTRVAVPFMQAIGAL